MVALVGDIGGTNARFALVEADGKIHSVVPLVCRNHVSLVEACEAYIRQVAPDRPPRRGALAVASPILGDEIQLTNLKHWSFSIEQTRSRLGLEKLDVVNDFVANAMAIPRLAPDDVLKIGRGEPVPHAPIWALGPGTGLGAAALVWTGHSWMPLSSEGGHMTIAAANDREAEILAFIRNRYSHVSAERVVSGMGLVDLYAAVAATSGKTPEPGFTPADITDRGLDRSCPICVETIEVFASMLGTVASDLAMVLNARGGIYIAGGIVPRLMPWFTNSDFRTRFEHKGRFSAFLAKVPTYIILRPLPALAGLAELVKVD
ncbi:MAG: glucokinase [Rhodospirillales bacterium]|nr:glucokinase [Rhodospirillales bacterium]